MYQFVHHPRFPENFPTLDRCELVESVYFYYYILLLYNCYKKRVNG